MLGLIYRHPHSNSIDDFIDELASCLEDLSNHKQVYYILGDINIYLFWQLFLSLDYAENPTVMLLSL